MASDDVETAQTITYMDELSAGDAADPAVIAAVHEALDDAGLTMTADPLAIAQAVFWWLKRNVRYEHVPGTNALVDQTLIAPTALLAMPERMSDCPQFSMLAAAMFRYLCIPCYFVTIAAEEFAPDEYSHVYNTVEVAPGKFLPFDSSNGPAPGAEYSKPYKRRVWDQITRDKCARKPGVRPMTRTTYRRAAGPGAGWRNRALRGAMGDTVCDDSGCYDTGVDTSTDTGDMVPSTGIVPVSQLPITSGGNPLGLPTTGAPAAPASGGILSQFLTDVTQLATPIVKAATTQKPYYITNPATGQQTLINPATGAAIGTGLASVSPTVIVIGIAGLLALSFLSKR